MCRTTIFLCGVKIHWKNICSGEIVACVLCETQKTMSHSTRNVVVKPKETLDLESGINNRTLEEPDRSSSIYGGKVPFWLLLHNMYIKRKIILPLLSVCLWTQQWLRFWSSLYSQLPHPMPTGCVNFDHTHWVPDLAVVILNTDHLPNLSPDAA